MFFVLGVYAFAVLVKIKKTKKFVKHMQLSISSKFSCERIDIENTGFRLLVNVYQCVYHWAFEFSRRCFLRIQ